MNTHDRTECRAVEDLLVALTAGELENELTSQLRAHLEHCSNCSLMFAEINRAQQLAADLKLNSPDVDRYPEFLRRLAASEARISRELEVRSDNAALVRNAASEVAHANGEAAEAGVAAVIPLFGNRLIVRNGFGGGFDLQIKSRQGKELVHVSANSLMKAAVVVGGFGLFAATSVLVIGFLAFSYFQKTDKTALPPEVIRQENSPQVGKVNQHHLPWIQTVTGESNTLAVWKAGHQVQAAFFDRRNNPISTPFILLLPIALEKQPVESALSDCALATDGENFVVVREQAGTIWAWLLKPSTSLGSKGEMPIALGDRALQPAIAWAGDRYLVVWIEPDPRWPKIRMLELDKDARPTQATALTVAETLRENQKVGSPAVAAESGKALILYQKQGDGLAAKIWRSTDGLSEAAIQISQQKAQQNGLLQARVLTAWHDEEFFLCWRAATGEGAEINFARISADGKSVKSQNLMLTRMPITAFDFRISRNQMALVWSENVAGGAQVLGQHLSHEGKSLGTVTNIFAGSEAPMALAFADKEGNAIIWHKHRQPNLQSAQHGFPVAVSEIDWKE